MRKQFSILLVMVMVLLFASPIFATDMSYEQSGRTIMFQKEYYIVQEVLEHINIINEFNLSDEDKALAAREICLAYANNNCFTDILLRYAAKGENFIEIYNNLIVVNESRIFIMVREELETKAVDAFLIMD